MDSPIMARFSSRETRIDLLHVQDRGLAHERAHLRERVGEHPQAVVLLGGHAPAVGDAERDDLGAVKVSLSRSSNSSSSLGFDAGKPASIMCTPSSSRACTTRSFSEAVSVMPPPPMPSRRVAS